MEINGFYGAGITEPVNEGKTFLRFSRESIQGCLILLGPIFDICK